MASSSATVQKDHLLYYEAFASTIKPYNTMKTNNQLRRGFTLVELLVVIVIIASLAGLTAPMVIRQRKKADQTEAVNNIRQIGFALIEFETEYSSFPDASTAVAVATNTGITANDVTSANGLFKQLFATGITKSEAMFYAKSAYTKKPDGVVTTAKLLEAGECGFGILLNGSTGYATSGNPGRVICATPFTKDAASYAFDKDYFDGKAVVLKLDNSVSSVNIILDTNKININGADLMSTDADTLFAGTTPTWVYPVKKPL
jgi:prepilin-type N-terminal cleavage/methylation domain-containing protein